MVNGSNSFESVRCEGFNVWRLVIFNKFV